MDIFDAIKSFSPDLTKDADDAFLALCLEQLSQRTYVTFRHQSFRIKYIKRSDNPNCPDRLIVVLEDVNDIENEIEIYSDEQNLDVRPHHGWFGNVNLLSSRIVGRVYGT